LKKALITAILSALFKRRLVPELIPEEYKLKKLLLRDFL
jgi:hypothetical protein